MTHAGMAPTRKNITVTIHHDKPSQNPAKADAGNTITFENLDSTEKLVRFAVDESGTEFYPIGLLLPGHKSIATIIAVAPENGEKSSTVYYAISTLDKNGRIVADPDDDTYQVIVGSSAFLG